MLLLDETMHIGGGAIKLRDSQNVVDADRRDSPTHASNHLDSSLLLE